MTKKALFITLVSTIIVSLLLLLPLESQATKNYSKCLSPVGFSEQLVPWEILCLGYPYYPNQVIGQDTLRQFNKLLQPYIDQKKVNNNNLVTEEINKCCKMFRKSEAYKLAKDIRENYSPPKFKAVQTKDIPPDTKYEDIDKIPWQDIVTPHETSAVPTVTPEVVPNPPDASTSSQI